MTKAYQALLGSKGRVLFAIALCLCSTAWIRPLMLPDEGRYASVAWEMLATGDWLTPTLNGLPFFHKPPLFYWISGAALALTGHTAFAARAGSLVGAVLGAYALYLFTLRWCGEEKARRTVPVLLAQPLFFLGAQFANLDTLVAGFITATILCLAHTALCFESNQDYRRSLLLAYLLAALGVLAKGLIGFVLPAMVIFLWLLVRRRWRSLWALISLPGLLLFLLVAAPWFVLMQQRFDGFLHYFFIVQHFQRFASGGFNNVEPFWFYPVALAVCSLPCLFWTKKAFSRSYWRAADGVLPDVRLLMGLTVICIVLFFSLPQSKLIGYIIPAVPALAWLMADLGFEILQSERARRWWSVSVLASALIGLAVVGALVVKQSYSAKPLSLVLQQQIKPQEPVYMLKEYVYDLPFYARLKQPVKVVEDWQNARQSHRDNWRTELLDAAAFNPVLAKATLLPMESVGISLCQDGGAWLIGRSEMPKDFPFLAQAEQVTASHGQVLWHINAQQAEALGCAKAGSQ